MVRGEFMKLFKNFLTFLFALNIVFGAALIANAQATQPTTLTKAERKQIIDYLKSTRDRVLKNNKGLSEAQLNFKAAPDRWSVREVTQHLALAEDFLFGMITNQVMKTPETPEKRIAVAGMEEKIIKNVPDRTSKFKAPEPIVPSDTRVPGDAAETFKTRRNNTIKFIKNTKENLRAHFMDTPGMGPADAWQWFFFIAAHSERHNKQIEEVIANPNFPKK
jgi:hypothetical protein